MGQPEPIEPQPGDDAPTPRGESRADWLCGAEEGLEAELGRAAHGTTPAPKLFRPGADAPAEAAPSAPAPRREGPPPPPLRLTLPTAAGAPAAPTVPPNAPRRAPTVQPDEEGSGFSHGPAMLWEPGANSVPALSRGAAAPPPPARPSAPKPGAAAGPEDFPMDDAEERARAAAEAAAAAAAAAERAAQPHDVVTPEAFDVKDAPVPWWMQVPQMLREDRRAQAVAAGVVVLLLALLFWPRAEKSISISNLRRDPQRFDGQDVRVSGRIGEIFTVGGGYAFYLHQGRDTLVVFSRTRTPRRGQGVTIRGMVSTGYLNGQSGTALFETTSK